MKHLRLYLACFILLCVSVVGFWIYTRYLKSNTPASLTFTVKRGSLDQLVRARGNVVTQKDYDLSFVSSGTIQAMLVKEGDVVEEGQTLARLDDTSLRLERARLVSVLEHRQAAYHELLSGTRTETVSSSQSKVTSAESALSDAKRALTDTQSKADASLVSLYQSAPDLLQSVSVAAQDAIHQKTDVLFTNPNTSNPSLVFQTSANNVSESEQERQNIGSVLTQLSEEALVAKTADHSDMDALLEKSEGQLDEIQTYLDTLSVALNGAIGFGDRETDKASLNTARSSIQTERSSVSALRQNIHVQVASNALAVSAAQAAVNAATNALAVAKKELALDQSGSVSEDISSAAAAVQEIQNQISSEDDALQKTTISAPSAGVIMVVDHETHEVVAAGERVIRFSSTSQKIEADISELDIGNIREGSREPVTATLDAYPDIPLTGYVTTVDEEPVIKDTDTYYRVNILLDHQPTTATVRSGMSADVLIHVSAVKDALKIPAFLVHKINGQSFVTRFAQGKQTDVPVVTGVTDGQDIQIVSGLDEGQTVVTSAP